MIRAHITRLHVNNKQANFINRCFGTRRFAFNYGLGKWNELKESGEQKISAGKIDIIFNAEKKNDYKWCYEVPSCVAQAAIKKDLDSAFKHFFRRVKKGEKPGYPKFKKRGCFESAHFYNTVIKDSDVKSDRVKLPKNAGIARLGDKPVYSGKLMNTTISKKSGKYYISFAYEIGETNEKESTGDPVGIDLGVEKLVTLSNGKSYDGVKPLKNNEKKLAKLQRVLSKKKKFSNNWKKQKQKITALHSYIANVRTNQLHKLSSDLVKNHTLVVLEDLKTKNMTKSSKGSIDKPGKKVKQKSGLNKSILDMGWHKFKTFLEYKSELYKTQVSFVNPKYTSQMCFECGYVDSENRKNQSTFKCVKCGHSDNADINAAKNILAKYMLECQ